MGGEGKLVEGGKRNGKGGVGGRETEESEVTGDKGEEGGDGERKSGGITNESEGEGGDLMGERG